MYVIVLEVFRGYSIHHFKGVGVLMVHRLDSIIHFDFFLLHQPLQFSKVLKKKDKYYTDPPETGTNHMVCRGKPRP